MLKKGNTKIFKFNPYKILEVFPLGTQGVVYKIQEHKGVNQFALKIVNEMSEKEIEITKWLQKNHHKNIVNVIDIEIQNKNVQILMECCDINLYQEIQEKLLNQNELRYFMISIAKGLQFLHENKIIHRDLKPENILIQTLTDKNNKELKQKIYKLADFGLSLQQERAQTKYIGTCYYMAPELLTNVNDTYNHKVDIWSLGVIVYELITGKTLFQGLTIQEIFNQISNQNKVENQQQLNQKLQILKDKQYFELVSNMLKYNPNDRYDINQVIVHLQNINQNIIRNRSSSCQNTADNNSQQQQLTITKQIQPEVQQFQNQLPIQLQQQRQIYKQYKVFNKNQSQQFQQNPSIQNQFNFVQFNLQQKNNKK